MNASRLGVVLVPPLVAACAAFEAADTVVARDADAGAPDSGSATLDSGGPGNPPDAGDVKDANESAVDSGAFCLNALFCDDFERPQPMGSWSEFAGNGDMVTLPEVSDAPQGNQLLRVQVNTKSGPTSWQHTRFFRAVSLGAWKRVEVTFHFRAPKLPLNGFHANLATIGVPGLSFVAFLRNTSIVAAISSNDANYSEVGNINRKVDEWDTARMVLDLPASTISLSIDSGDVAKDKAVSLVVEPTPAMGLELGPAYSDIDTTFTLDFDALEVHAP